MRHFLRIKLFALVNESGDFYQNLNSEGQPIANNRIHEAKFWRDWSVITTIKNDINGKWGTDFEVQEFQLDRIG